MSSSAQESFFGLGFANNYQSVAVNASADNDGTATCASSSFSPAVADTISSSSAVNNMEKLMESYMQQCLSYHDQQLEQQRQQEKNPSLNQNTTSTQEDQYSLTSSSTTPPLFISASKSTETQMKDKDYQQKLQNARLIAQKLASKSKPISTTTTQLNLTTFSSYSNSKDDYPYAQKRRDFMTNIHSNKLRSHLLKNFDYILKKDEEVHSIQIQHLLQQQQLQTTMNQPKKQKRHNGVVFQAQSVMGGIGTQERKKLQKSIDKQHHSFLQKGKKRKNHTKCCALYINGIKHQTHQRRQQQQQKMIREMFDMYGTIKTCTFYIDKQTNMYKGDGLLVYNWEDILKTKYAPRKEEEGESKCEHNMDHDGKVDDFLNMICSQVRGAIFQVLYFPFYVVVFFHVLFLVPKHSVLYF